jgi:hypothetical protein
MTATRMDDRTVSRRACFALPALLVLIARSDARAAGPPVGRVEEVRGTATAELGPSKRPLSSNAEIYVGEKISTADQSRVAVRLGKDTKLRLGEKASMKVDRFQDSGGEVTLEEGPALIEKPARSAPKSVTMRSPSGDLTIRDGKAFAGPSQGVFGVLAVRGEVTVRGGGRSVRLRAGEGTDIKSPGAAPTPARRWGKARVQAALALVD